MRILLILIYFVSPVFAFCQPKPEKAFVIKEKDLIPEGIAFDPADNSFFVSSMYKKKIVKISKKGKVTDFVSSGKDKLEEVLGMKVDSEGRLWACNNSPDYDTANWSANVHVYDTRNATILKHFKLTDGKRHLFNDLYITKTGDVYITDSDAGAIWKIRNNSNTIDEFISAGKLRYPNGLTATEDDKKLIVSTGSGLGIVTIDIETKEIKSLQNDRYFIIGMDGLYRYKNSLIGVQNVVFPESVQQLHLIDSLERVKHIEFLCPLQPEFDVPTTGVIVDNQFYFIANSQLRQLVNNKGKIRNPDQLKDVIIMRIKLN